jgi:HlyD family secretion protein
MTTPHIARYSRRRLALLLAGALAATLLVIAFAPGLLGGSLPDVPTGDVTAGEFVDYIQLRGEIRPQKSIMIMAPSQAGADLQIIGLARNGTPVKRGDVVVAFGTAQIERTLQEKRSELRQVEAEIEQVRAQARLKEEENLAAVARATYDVERAKLETDKRDLVSKIEAEQAQLALLDAEERLREAETTLDADREGALAEAARKRQTRETALFELRRAERSLEALQLRAPTDGLVTLLPNYRAGASFGQNAPEFREGDRVWPGAAVAQLPDLSTVRLWARLDETERGRLQEGQAAIIRIEAVPDRELSGRVTDISILARVDFTNWPPVKQFEVEMELVESDPRLRPGMAGQARVAVERIADALLMPAAAALQEDGQTVAYVQRRNRFERRSILVGQRSGDQLVVLEGLAAGDRVALRDPSKPVEAP